VRNIERSLSKRQKRLLRRCAGSVFSKRNSSRLSSAKELHQKAFSTQIPAQGLCDTDYTRIPGAAATGDKAPDTKSLFGLIRYRFGSGQRHRADEILQRAAGGSG